MEHGNLTPTQLVTWAIAIGNTLLVPVALWHAKRFATLTDRVNGHGEEIAALKASNDNLCERLDRIEHKIDRLIELKLNTSS